MVVMGGGNRKLAHDCFPDRLRIGSLLPYLVVGQGVNLRHLGRWLMLFGRVFGMGPGLPASKTGTKEGAGSGGKRESFWGNFEARDVLQKLVAVGAHSARSQARKVIAKVLWASLVLRGW